MEPLTIVSLEAENLKRLKAVRIEPDPDGNLVVISGRNGQGKTSVLDSIWLALAGKEAAKHTKVPIRSGEKYATVVVDLGEFVVQRWWYADGSPSKLAVVAKDDGRPKRSPQTFLDDRLGALSFDPLAFTRKAAKDQLADLIELVDLPFDPIQTQINRDMLYGERTDVGRTLKSLQGQYDGLDVPDDVPDEEVSTAEVLEQLAAAEAMQRQQDEIRTAQRLAFAKMENRAAQVRELRSLLAEAEAGFAEAKQAAAAMDRAVSEFAEIPDLDSFRYALANAEALNAGVREKQAKRDLAEQISDVQSQYESYTKRIDDIDRAKAAAVANAAMPVPGLSFDDEGVMFNGIPFGQCSAAEQLKVSIAMAIAANPTIGVIRITDGSLLDRDSLAVLTAMAQEAGVQVWIERVSDDGGIGFVIEDGEVVS
jgi:hypothetical protein